MAGTFGFVGIGWQSRMSGYWAARRMACSRIGAVAPLPMEADAESLNVAAAAAVLFYQSRFRQEKDGALRG